MTAAPTPAASGMWRGRGVYVTGAALVVIAAVAWASVILPSAGVPMETMEAAGVISPAGAGVFLVAWGVMMAAMMLPSAAPMIVLYETVRRSRAQPAAPTVLFAAIYLAMWVALGVPVYLAGLVVAVLAESVPLIAAGLPYALAVVLVATGAYQFTALKQSCLRSCRTPLSFLMRGWQGGYMGTLKLAGAHAAYCIGCCSALMVVLVAAGAMSLPWVLLIAAVVFVEKLLPGGDVVGRVVGVGFVILGLAVAIDPDLAATLRGNAMHSSM